MKTGDVLHVPSEVTLLRQLGGSGGAVSTIYFKTVAPKFALYLGDHGDEHVKIEYGENTWLASKKDITLMEKCYDC